MTFPEFSRLKAEDGDLGARQTWPLSQSCHSLAVWPQAGFCTSLSVISLIHKEGTAGPSLVGLLCKFSE